MAIEYRNGKPYYYRKKRIGSKIVSEYVGGGKLAIYAASLDRNDKKSIIAKQQLELKDQTLNSQMDEELNLLETKLNELFTIVAFENGYHKPKRQWRKKRQKKQMNQSGLVNY